MHLPCSRRIYYRVMTCMQAETCRRSEPWQLSWRVCPKRPNEPHHSPQCQITQLDVSITTPRDVWIIEECFTLL